MRNPPFRAGGFGDAFRRRAGPGRIAYRFRAFATHGARGESEAYEKLALGIADSPELLAFLAQFPPERQQPNLFLAAIRYLHGVPEGIGQLSEIVRQDTDAIRALMLSRTTQTNEPARCTALLPLLARLRQPLAIVEVGASAGLCLLPDRYGYDYGAARIVPATPDAPTFPCAAEGPVPYPAALPRIVWRRGLDLRPIDTRSDEEVAWLEALIWPGQDYRLRWLRAAVAVARRDPPPLVQGDLRTDLAALLATAPTDATLVVYHSAVLAYVTASEERRRFVETVRAAGAVWISNEDPSVFPDFAASAPPSPARGRFLLMQDGMPVAWTAPHGQSLDWFGAA